MNSDDWRKRWEIRHEQACGRFCAGPEQCEIAFRLALLDENEALRAAVIEARDHLVIMQKQAGRCPRCEGIEEAITKALGDAS